MSYTRIATHSSQSAYINRMMLTQSNVSKYGEALTSGYKSTTYSGIPTKTMSLVNFENQTSKINQFLQNNGITATKLDTMELSMETISDKTTDFRTALRMLLETDLGNITTTMSEDTLNEIANVQSMAFNTLKQIEDALNVQVNGEFLFSGGKNLTASVSSEFSTLKEFQAYYDGELVTYPESRAANLSTVETADNITGGFTLTQHVAKLGYDDDGNPVAVAGSFVFSYDDNKITANPGTFSEFSSGGVISLTGTLPAGLNDGNYFVSSVSEDGSTIRLSEETRFKAPPIPTYANGMNPDGVTPVKMTIDNGSGVTTTVDFSANNNNVTFDFENNKVTVDNYHTFNGIKTGDKVTFSGTACDPYGSGTVSNDRTFTVKKISADGREMELEETISHPNIPDGQMTGVAGDLTITQDNNIGYIDSVLNDGVTIISMETGSNYMDFDDKTITVNPSDLPDFFKNVKAGQSITVSGSTSNDGTYYVTSVDLATGKITVDATLVTENSNNIKVDAKSLEHGFVSENILGGETTTGTLYFNANKNQMIATNANSFSTLNAGDTIVINGTSANNGVKIIQSVSDDGKTITFSDETPIADEGTPIDPPFNHYTKIDNGTGVNIGKSYAIGSTVNLNNIDSKYDGVYTVIGVENDGNRLIVKADNFPKVPFTTSSETFLATGKMSINSSSYYQGDEYETIVRTDLNDVMNIGINAEESAIEKVIRALGIIAQGNLVDTNRDDGIDADRTLNRVSHALDLLDEALGTKSTGESTLLSLTYKITLNQTNLSDIVDYQKSTKSLLQDSISDIENMDPTEAAVKLQEQALILNYSYSVLNTVNSLSLLQYL